MATNQDLRRAWREFTQNMTPSEIKKLEEAGFDLANPLDDNLPEFHRLLENFEPKDDDDVGPRKSAFGGRDKLKRQIEGRIVDEARREPEASDTAMDFAVAVAARVIDAFDCNKSPEVRLHIDCMKLALGYPACGSQKEIAAKWGMSKASVSWRVRHIQRKLNLPLCVFNGNRTNR